MCHVRLCTSQAFWSRLDNCSRLPNRQLLSPLHFTAILNFACLAFLSLQLTTLVGRQPLSSLNLTVTEESSALSSASSMTSRKRTYRNRMRMYNVAPRHGHPTCKWNGTFLWPLMWQLTPLQSNKLQHSIQKFHTVFL